MDRLRLLIEPKITRKQYGDYDMASYRDRTDIDDSLVLNVECWMLMFLNVDDTRMFFDVEMFER